MLTLLNPFEVWVKFIRAALKLNVQNPRLPKLQNVHHVTYGNKLLKASLGNPRIVFFRATLPAL